MVTSHKAAQSAIWALFESGGVSILSLASLFLMARLVGPTDFGLAALALGIVQLLTIVVEMLLHDALVQRAELHERQINTAFWSCLGLGIVLSGLCLVISQPLSVLFDQPLLGPVMAVAGIGLLFSGLGCVPMALLRRDLKLKPLALRSLYGKLAGGVIGVTMAFLGWGVWALIIQQVVQVAVNALLVWPACPWRPRAQFSLSDLKELLSFGAVALSARVIWIATTRLFTILIGYYLDMTAVGFWNIALRIVDTLYDLLGGAAHNLALPIFSRRQKDRETLARAYRSATSFTALTALPVFIGLAYCAPLAIELMLGPTWMGAAPVVRILAAVAAVNLTLLYGHVAIMAVGQPGLIVGLSIVSFVCAIGGLLLFQPTTLTGVAFVWISRTVFTAPVLIYLVNRLFGVSPWAVLREVAVPSVGVAIMVLVLVILAEAALAGQPLWLALIASISVGALTYVTIVALADRAAIRRFTELALVGVRGLRTS